LVTAKHTDKQILPRCLKQHCRRYTADSNKNETKSEMCLRLTPSCHPLGVCQHGADIA